MLTAIRSKLHMLLFWDFFHYFYLKQFKSVIPPEISNSTKEQRRSFVEKQWRCLNCCEMCGKCQMLRGKDAGEIYADYINGEREYIEITMALRESK